MALQMPYKTKKGFTSEQSYSKVVGSSPALPVVGKSYHEVLVEMFNTKEDRQATPPSETVNSLRYIVRGDEYDKFFALAVLDGAGCNPIKQAYAFLKEHVPVDGEPDFRGATDA
jgi:hypothetical protein